VETLVPRRVIELEGGGAGLPEEALSAGGTIFLGWKNSMIK
jgi:hypothetical protein